jgi:hypothetical protein
VLLALLADPHGLLGEAEHPKHARRENQRQCFHVDAAEDADQIAMPLLGVERQRIGAQIDHGLWSFLEIRAGCRGTVMG